MATDQPVAAPEDPARELRDRALAAMLVGYEKLRRGLAYLRLEEDDAELLAPSLFAQKSRRRLPLDLR